MENAHHKCTEDLASYIALLLWFYENVKINIKSHYTG